MQQCHNSWAEFRLVDVSGWDNGQAVYLGVELAITKEQQKDNEKRIWQTWHTLKGELSSICPPLP